MARNAVSEPAAVDEFGRLPDGRPVNRYTFRNDRGMVLSVLDLGALVQQLRVPDARGMSANVVLGSADLAGYLQAPDHFFGAVVGRYANRIASGRLVIDGDSHGLLPNDGPHTLHGGPDGFHRRRWEVLSTHDAGLLLRLISPDGDQGFPGMFVVAVSYELADNEVRIAYTAATDAPTVVNLTSHAHFNLAGEGSGSVEDHLLQVNAESYTPVGPDLIPTGAIEPVAGTPLDFRRIRPIGERLRDPHEQLRRGRGYDHNYVLALHPGLPSAVLADPRSGRTLEVHTDQPGLQLYTGNFFDGSHAGTGGSRYRQSDGVALETQHFPDSPNQPQFPSTVLYPGQTFKSWTVWRFPEAARPTS